MNQQDKECLAVCSAVIGAITVFGVIAFFIASALSEQIAEQPSVPAAEVRIQPVGSVAVDGVASSQPAKAMAPVAAAPAAPMSGKDVYTKACFACHGTGAAGAPKVGDAAAWASRSAQGMDVLVEHAVNGFQGSTGFMPPKGGHPYLTDDNIKDAIQHILDATS